MADTTPTPPVSAPVEQQGLPVVGDSDTRQQGIPVTVDSDATQAPRPERMRPLSPDAAAVAQYMVFVPRQQQWFVAAVRAKHVVVDVGRMDAQLGTTASDRAAFREAAERLTPLPLGTRLELRGDWGVDTGTVSGFQVSNGRLVGALEVSPATALLARKQWMPAISAVRLKPVPPADSVSAIAVTAIAVTASDTGTTISIVPLDSCVRSDTLSTALNRRVKVVVDSLRDFLWDSVAPPPGREPGEAPVRVWSKSGCFASGRVMVIATRKTADADMAMERVLLLSDTTQMLQLRVSDLRFRSHEPLLVFDADGDGVDDIATHGQGAFSGATTILRLDTASRRLTRLASGFAWESR